ncbi:MAG: esterase family protein [Chitinophagaceae bacterium]|nr:esterase family protein [Chitinophagaceae bacterium]
MKREYHKFPSEALGKDMELLVFGHAGEAIIFFPTRTARFYDYEDWRIIEALAPKIDAGLIQVFCVDSVDVESFYAQVTPEEKILRHLEYEKYILEEVIPLVEKTSPGAPITVAGCSLGGYHAVNIAFKHPGCFKKVVALSSRYDLTLSTDKFPDLLDGASNEAIYYNMPSMYMPHLEDESFLEKIRKLDITLAVGREDPFYENNVQLSEVLHRKGIKHQFYVWNEEAHRPRFWRSMVKWYL